MKKKRRDLKHEFEALCYELYNGGYWISPELKVVHVSRMSDELLADVFSFYLLEAYNLSSDMRLTPEETRLAALERLDQHPLWFWLYEEMVQRQIGIEDKEIWWILEGG